MEIKVSGKNFFQNNVFSGFIDGFIRNSLD